MRTTRVGEAVRFEEMRLVECPGCHEGLESRHWDDLSEEEPEEEYHCDCGVSFLVTRAEGMAVTVQRVEYEE